MHDIAEYSLIVSDKELSAEKERKDIELQAQRATLQEQRNHIDILDNALNNAQANVVRMEEEVRGCFALCGIPYTCRKWRGTH